MVVVLPEPKLYPSGSVFVKYSPDGGSFAYYPSGRMAAAYERLGGGFYAYFYADTKAGTTLLAMDPHGEGFCAYPNGKPHLTSMKTGGTLVGEDGAIQRLWTATKALDTSNPISMELSPQISVTFTSRQLIRARITCQGMTEDYQLGEVQQATDSYLTKSVGVVKMGPERGKKILDIDKCRQAAQVAKERREAMSVKEVDLAKTKITEQDMQKHLDLRPIISATTTLKDSIRQGDWDVECYISKEKLQSTLGASLPTLTMGDSLKGDAHSRTFASLPATQPDVLSALLKSTEFDGRPLPLSSSIKAASGRYRPDHGVHYRTPRTRLKPLTSKTLDRYISEEVPNTTMVVVCCLASYIPQCRRVEPLLEMLNGKLDARAGDPTLTYNETIDPAKGRGQDAEGGGRRPSELTMPEFELRKFDMGESRFLRDRYNINTLPMYLMYNGGKLVYAKSTLNGYGTSMDDLVAQIRISMTDAQRGAYLPDGFTFGQTSNETTDAFASTLKSTADVLGK